MDTLHLPSSGQMLKQHLLIEFNGLKTACPQGVFMSLSPSDPALWTGVIFVRKGPYAPAILRFQISFPPAYPTVPPLITFSSDIFHPLVAPLTVQLYTSSEDGTSGIIILDDERLSPGGFSLRHGFPSWFKRTRSKPSGDARPLAENDRPTTPLNPPKNQAGSPGSQVSDVVLSPGSLTSRDMADPEDGITTYELLRYIRSTFDDASVLDEIPLEAAGNSGAWSAWSAYRSHEAHMAQPKNGPAKDGLPVDKTSPPKPIRQPGEWNWEGVWEVRAKKGVDLSVSEAVLYGNSTSNEELINFLQADEDIVEILQGNMMISRRDK